MLVIGLRFFSMYSFCSFVSANSWLQEVLLSTGNNSEEAFERRQTKNNLRLLELAALLSSYFPNATRTLRLAIAFLNCSKSLSVWSA
jgi:hypothetical protein